MNRKAGWALLALVVSFALVGMWRGAADESGGGAWNPAAGNANAVQVGADAAPVRYVRWRHPQGLFSAEVPAGWRIEGRIDPQGLDKGAFMIRGFAPDGRSMFTFAHNWLWFMEYQYGRYRPGNATLEGFVVPGLAGNLPEMNLRTLRVAYIGPNSSFQVANPQTGLPLYGAQGALGLLAANARGDILAGTLLGETMYIPVPGSPGLWSLRIFSGGLAPSRPADQAGLLAIQKHVFESLELAPEFMQAWNDAHQRTAESMRAYSRDMERVFGGYLDSARRDPASGKSPEEKWSEMMRDGHYEQDDRTGDRYWVGNDAKYWWKNDRGILVGNDTGQPPDGHDNWYGTHP